MKEFGKGEESALSPRRTESGLSAGLRRRCGGRSCSVRLASGEGALAGPEPGSQVQSAGPPHGSSSPSFAVIGSDQGTGPSAQSRPSPGRGHRPWKGPLTSRSQVPPWL